MGNMKICVALLIAFFTASVNKVYAEELQTWTCHDESNLYKVIVNEKIIKYKYFDDFYNKNLDREFRIQTSDENGKIYAIQSLAATPAAEKGYCGQCFSGGVVILDRDSGKIHRGYISISYNNGQIKDESWESNHKCRLEKGHTE